MLSCVYGLIMVLGGVCCSCGDGLCPFQNLWFFPCPFALVSKRAGGASLFSEGVSAVAGTDEVCRADMGRVVEGEPFTLE